MIQGGATIRVEHIKTHKNLHSHNIASHTNAGGDQHEVSCYQADEAGDGNDNWRVECNGELNKGEAFRLVHVSTNGALHSHTRKYPFIDQNEVTSRGPGRDDNDMFVVSEIKSGMPQARPQWNGQAICYGMVIKIKHQKTNWHLHSHAINYPGGSRQQQVTCYGGNDDNDLWEIKGPHGERDNQRNGTRRKKKKKKNR